MSNEIVLFNEKLKEGKEVAKTNKVKPIPVMRKLDQVLAELGPMPMEALMLGICTDEAPVLLNLHDPVPGPLLITGDAGSGKTRLLKFIAAAAEKMHKKEEVSIGVITEHPDDWDEIKEQKNVVGVFHAYRDPAKNFLLSLYSWGHNKEKGQQSVVLLLDNLEIMRVSDMDTLQNLRWLLARGPANRVWPIISIPTKNRMLEWVGGFRTKLYGRVKDDEKFDKLEAGREFKFHERGEWNKFWLPEI